VLTRTSKCLIKTPKYANKTKKFKKDIKDCKYKKIAGWVGDYKGGGKE